LLPSAASREPWVSLAFGEYMIRYIVQSLLCIRILPIIPLAMIFGLAAFTPKFWREAPTFTFQNWISYSQFFIFAIALPLLILSIFLRPEFIKSKPWLYRLMISSQLCGILSLIIVLCIGIPSLISDTSQTNTTSYAQIIWIFGGPLIVSIWNSWRILKTPNHTLHPTSLRAGCLKARP
jgi:hypothetical protein